MKPWQVKDRLYTLWADTAKALASPKRLEILDLLAQGERTVEALAGDVELTVTNTSSHLSVLKRARLVDTRKDAQFVSYRLADDAVVGAIRALQQLARKQLHEVDHLAQTYLDGRDALEPIDATELRRRLREGDVTVIDVRSTREYEAAHIAGAISVPLDQLDHRLTGIPKSRLVVAYCRGPYCVLAIEATEKLRMRGYDVRRLTDGMPDWRLAGLPLAVGADPRAVPRRTTPTSDSQPRTRRNAS